MSFFSVSTPSTPTTAFSLRQIPTHPSFSSLTILVPNPSPNPRPSKFRVLQCRASKSQTRPVKKRQPSSSSNKKKKKGKNLSSDAEFVDDLWADDNSDGEPSGLSTANHPMPLPKPPAGFVVDDLGRVLMASNKRLVTIVDPLNNLPLECVIRRVFRSSKDEECMLLCPADMPVQILKSTNIEGWTALDDEEIEPMLPDVAYALAKIHMHLVQSGFCYTARGGFCYSEGDILDFCAAEGEDVDSLPTEGVEITCFHLDGSHYMIYTPSDPLLFVAVKDQNGQLRIADDDLLQDPAVISAIDEETEFNALVEEETALLESLIMGEG